ncbi:Sporulation RMD1 [Cryptosporidium sp. chipmunk genotype I]|uniref:Sporulation RMD1 n=1 Tax=Cryptosporidium sp. chipmunk genotype I TaxID=1280935 RepID=UPI00351A4908|nr:Sporulation RMD1 [Cryptosporidium sp. chipmunk genotype I]
MDIPKVTNCSAEKTIAGSRLNNHFSPNERTNYPNIALNRTNFTSRADRRGWRFSKWRNTKFTSEMSEFSNRNGSINPTGSNSLKFQSPELSESFNVIRGFCLCEGYNLESIRSALDKHNYCHWYVDKEKTILAFDLNPYFDKIEITWATQGRLGKVLFPAGIYPSIQMILGRTARKRTMEDNLKNYIICHDEIANWRGVDKKSSNIEDKTKFLDDKYEKHYFSYEKHSVLQNENQSKPITSSNLKHIYNDEMTERGEFYSNDENYWKRLENPIFIFKNGVIVAWSNEEVTSNSVTYLNSPKCSDERFEDIITFLSLYSFGGFVGKYSKNCQYYTMLFNYGNFAYSRFYRNNRKMISDIVTLKTRSAEEKLAASLAIGQSIRLSLFEDFIEDCVENIKYLPLKLAQVGASSVIEEEFKVEVPQVRKRFSELYSYQISVNLVEDFLDIPEIFWHNYKFHSVWRNLQEYLEISERLQVLNRRIVMMQELLRVITEEYQTTHANRLTWIVIILLAINCFFSFFRHILLNHPHNISELEKPV